jgi:hypothetical protein
MLSRKIQINMIRANKEHHYSEMKTLKQFGFFKFIDQLRRLWQSSTKQLSMVFFVGRGRAHTFRIPLVLVYSLLAVVGVSTVWSVVSTGLLLFFFNQNNWLESQLNMTRGIVLKYQAQYEKVFERSYPQMAQNPAANAMENAELDLERLAEEQKAAAKAQDAAKSERKEIAALAADEAPEWTSGDGDDFATDPLAEKAVLSAASSTNSPVPVPSANTLEKLPSVTEQSVTAVPPVAEIKAIPTVVANEGVQKAEVAAVPPASEANVQPSSQDSADNRGSKSDLLRPEDLSVRDLRIAPTDRGIDVNFNLQNSGRLPKAQGYLVTIGEFTTSNGQKIYKIAPEMPGFDAATGKVTDYKRGESFAAARFRSSRMTLSKPDGTEGRFTSVRIVLTDREGKIADETTKEVKNSDVAVTSPAAEGG